MKKELHPYLINLIWVKGLNTGCETVKGLEEHLGTEICDIGLGHDFLNMMSKARTTEAKRVELHRTKNLLQGVPWWCSS